VTEKGISIGFGRTKHWIPNRNKRKLMLGEDVGLADTVSMALCVLVGRFLYRARCTLPLVEWVHTTWLPLLGYLPEIVYLTKGWFGFRFKKVEDTATILEKPWIFYGASLMLKRWRVSFDPALDYFALDIYGFYYPACLASVECEGLRGYRECTWKVH
jgi:hypothetical protein